MLEPDEIGNVIEEVVDLSREINLEMDSSRTAGFPQSGADNEFIKMRSRKQTMLKTNKDQGVQGYLMNEKRGGL
ncbi:hypothetical protein TNCV_1511121 [Trichonephila clavipes]|nr:hypothetical protein TNCV_1511121 [Trichonephila clavipes]